MKTFILSEADIQSIINGRDVIKQDGNSKILIRQSYAKDILAPIINDRFIVSDSEFENRIRTTNNNIINPLFRKWETMTFINPVKNEVVTSVAPCGFSKSRHKKMVKKKMVKDISLEDLNNIGYGISRFFKGLSDGINRGIKEDFNKSVIDVDDQFDI